MGGYGVRNAGEKEKKGGMKRNTGRLRKRTRGRGRERAPTHLDVHIAGMILEQQILRFEIAVHDSSAVEVGESLEEDVDQVSRFTFAVCGPEHTVGKRKERRGMEPQRTEGPQERRRVKGKRWSLERENGWEDTKLHEGCTEEQVSVTHLAVIRSKSSPP